MTEIPETPRIPDSPRLLADEIIDGVEKVLNDAVAANKPLEVDPARGRLFEMFVAAEAGGYICDDAEVPVSGIDDGLADLSSDMLCRQISIRWGLDAAARESVGKQEKMTPDELARMRILWSFLRMWMEWSYAWKRWSEFHS